MNVTPKAPKSTQVVIIGGGLAGMVAAIRLQKSNVSVVLIDAPISGEKSALGGFAKFSGAKFSLPPAGLGLSPVAGGDAQLDRVINQVSGVLDLNLEEAEFSCGGLDDVKTTTTLRKYASIVLTPREIDQLIERVIRKLGVSTSILLGRVINIERRNAIWRVSWIDAEERVSNIECGNVFYAAGRLSESLLINAGATPNEGKGLDIGYRIEFMDLSGLQGLRSLGPDAKVLKEDCRTFCLNSPGTIYRYPFMDGSIELPGGVVADESVRTANVGVLLRLKEKSSNLDEIIFKLSMHADAAKTESQVIRTSKFKFKLPLILNEIYGVDLTKKLEDFGQDLNDAGLWDTSMEHKIHLPLIDWHWKTFALPGSHKTTLPGVYALGDSAGHARGLLQACISGWLAAEELCDVR